MDHMKRIQELSDKKERLKSHRLGKKESNELRQLVDDNANLFMIFCWNKEDIALVENLLKENKIKHMKQKMPEKFDLTFF